MARESSPAVTPELAEKIRQLMRDGNLYQHQVAAMFGINQGRVSEVMTGKLCPKAPPTQGDFQL